MSEPESSEDVRKKAGARAGGDLLWSLVSAGLFLYVGFGLVWPEGGADALYDGSGIALIWGARSVGIGILVAAAGTYFHVPGAVLLDLALAVVATVGCLAIGAIWMVYGNMQGFLLLLFGLLNASAVRGGWQRWHGAS